MSNRHWLVFGLLYTVILFTALWYVHRHSSEKTRFYLALQTREAQVELNVTVSSLNTVADAVFDTVINTPRVRELLAEAAWAGQEGAAETLDQSRRELLAYLDGTYRQLKKHNIRQLHFQLPGNISFLRLHKPEKYGDSLRGVRHSIDRAQATGQAVKGFEEGRIFNGFRNIYPMFQHDVLVGTVEISYSFEAIRQNGMNTFPAVYSFIIRKDTVNATVWEEEQTAYVPSRLSEAFYLDRAVNTQLRRELDRNSRWMDSARLDRIDSLMAESIKHRLAGHEGFTVTAGTPPEHILVSFAPILNQSGKHVAFCIVYHQDNTLETIQRELHFNIAMVLLAHTLLFLLVVSLSHAVTRERRLMTLADTDRLTGAINRRAFDLLLDQCYRTAKRGEAPFSLAIGDIDDFKVINDTYGHDVGDLVLVAFVRLLKERCREEDIVARWGGEEFAIIFRGVNGEQHAAILERIRCAVAELRLPHGERELRFTASFGICGHQPGLGRDALLRRVDQALYAAKKSGKNCIRVSRDQPPCPSPGHGRGEQANSCLPR